MKTDIKCFIFDFNGVLFHNADVIRTMLEREGFAKEPLDALGGYGRIGHEYIIGKLTHEEYLKEAQKLFPHDYRYITEILVEGKGLLYIDTAWLRREIVDKFRINFDFDIFASDKISTIDILSELYDRYALCLFSGNAKYQIETLDKKYDFMRYFSYSVLSYDVGADKPDKRMFDCLIKTLPYKPEECIYIDDREENIIAGNRYGFHSILFPFEAMYIKENV